MAPLLLIFIIEFLSSTEAMNCPSCLSKANIDFAIIGGAAGGACLLAVMIIVVVVCLLKRRKNKEYNKPPARRQGYSAYAYENCHPDEPSNVGEDAGSKGTQVSDDMIILENPMYVSADSVPKREQSNTPSDKPCYQPTVHNGENPRETFSGDQHLNPNNIYAVVNKKPKATDNPSKPTTTTNPSKPIQSHIYAVVNKTPKATDNPAKPTTPTKPSKPIKTNIYTIVNKNPKATGKLSKPTTPAKPSKPIKPPKPYPQTKPAMAVKPPVPQKPITKL
ncbi:hypothetical protein SNE40_017143 [Patella caerulea]|uniref:Uncharacterized protein n=1 Tax=Patella caerulea TaxID=87958 RepID=A0AAN8JDA4_PATCE